MGCALRFRREGARSTKLHEAELALFVHFVCLRGSFLSKQENYRKTNQDTTHRFQFGCARHERTRSRNRAHFTMKLLPYFK